MPGFAVVLAAGIVLGTATAAPATAPATASAAKHGGSEIRPVTATSGSYRLVSVRLRESVTTPAGHTFTVDATYPRLVGGSPSRTQAFNNQVAAAIQDFKAEQGASIDDLGGCAAANLTGGWSGRKLVKKHYASVLIAWDRGDCGGVAWDYALAGVTASVRTGKLHDLPYLIRKLGGAKQADYVLWDATTWSLDHRAGFCHDSDALYSIDPFAVLGWRVTSKGMTLGFIRYQVGPGACGSPIATIPWKAYRSALDVVLPD